MSALLFLNMAMSQFSPPPRTQCKNQSEESNKLVAANRVLVEGQRDAVRKLSRSEQRLQEKKEECNTLKIK